MEALGLINSFPHDGIVEWLEVEDCEGEVVIEFVFVEEFHLGQQSSFSVDSRSVRFSLQDG